MPIATETKPDSAYFRFESDANVPALQTQLIQQQRDKYKDTTNVDADESDLLNNYYGEMIFGF